MPDTLDENNAYPQDGARLANSGSGKPPVPNKPAPSTVKPKPGPENLIVKGGPGKAPGKRPTRGN